MKTNKTEHKSTKYRFGEATILFAIILAVAIGIGMKMNSSEAEETVAVRPAAASTYTNAELAAQALAAAEAAAEVVEIAEIAEVVAPVEPEPEYGDAVPASQIYTDGETCYFERDFAEASRIFATYTERRPANAWGHYMHGLSLWKAGELDKAEVALSQAIELKPDHVKSLVNLARVQLAQERAEDALAPVTSALIIDPGYADGYRVLGRVYHNLGRREEAVTAYLSALSRREDDAWAMNNLGLVYLELDRPQDALAPLAGAVFLDDGQPVFHNNLGLALEQTGHMIQAAAVFARAVELDDHVKAATSLARVDQWLNSAGEREIPEADLAALASGFFTQLQVAVESNDDMSTTEQAPVPVVSAEDSTAVSSQGPTTVATADDGF